VRSIPRACLAASAVSGILVAVGTEGAEAASRIVDHTVGCRMTGTGYPDPIRSISVGASARSKGPHLPPFVSARNGASGEAGVSAGLQTGPSPSHWTGYALLSRSGCRSTRLRLPLSSRGLLGGSTEADRTSYGCEVPASVLIRIRAVFTRPTRFSSDPRSPWQLVARGKIATGSLAVATMPGRKPIFFGSAPTPRERQRRLSRPPAAPQPRGRAAYAAPLANKARLLVESARSSTKGLRVLDLDHHHRPRLVGRRRLLLPRTLL
jgi:hypothetical protein